MHKNNKFGAGGERKSSVMAEIRQKLNISQYELATLLGLSRSVISMAEAQVRELPSAAFQLVTKIYLQFDELERGIQADYRSLETRVVLNDIYKSAIPAMKEREKNCRCDCQRLSQQLQDMKQREKNQEHAIIVHTNVLKELEQKEQTDKATLRQIEAVKLFKNRAYHGLTLCWAPEQVKLRAKMEALRAEARVLRSTRTKIVREHGPFK